MDLSGSRFNKYKEFDQLDNALKRSFNESFKVGKDGLSEFSTEQIKAKANAMGLNEALTQQALSLASDATLTQKAATGKLTFSKAIESNEKNAEKLIEALKNSNSDVLKKFKTEEVMKAIEASGEEGSAAYNT